VGRGALLSPARALTQAVADAGAPHRGSPGGFRGCCIAWGTLTEVHQGGRGVDRDAHVPPGGCLRSESTSMRALEVTWDPLRPVHRPPDVHLANHLALWGDRIDEIRDCYPCRTCL